MTSRAPLIISLLLASGIVVGCASGGAVPRPRPFPGAKVPPAEAGEPEPASPAEGGPLVPGLIATALALRGTPYLNGGSEPTRGFDCSGFVQWVFGRHGAALPREVRDQFDHGEQIDREDVRPGDLIFFETVSGGASHVGIALGGGEFVHAPNSRGFVRVERYTSGYWSTRWIGARRIVVPVALVG